MVRIMAVEPLLRSRAGPPEEGSIQCIGPAVVGAPHDVAVGRIVAGDQFMATVSTRVEEGSQLAFGIPDQQYGFATRGDRCLIARLRNLVRAAHADPRAREEVLHLPLEHPGRRVCAAGQRARLTREVPKARFERMKVQRSGGRHAASAKRWLLSVLGCYRNF